VAKPRGMARERRWEEPSAARSHVFAPWRAACAIENYTEMLVGVLRRACSAMPRVQPRYGTEEMAECPNSEMRACRAARGVAVHNV